MALQFHALANLFPLMEGQEFDGLVSDIREHGLREPIVLHEGAILDGRNRYRACEAAEIKLRTRELAKATDPLAFVVSANLKRRHLDESQRQMVGARIANLRQGQKVKTGKSAGLTPVTQAQAAKLMNTSERGVRAAAVVLREAEPELIAAVDKGAIAVDTAAQLVRLPPEQQREAAAKPKAAKGAAKRHVRTRREGELAERTIAAAEAAPAKLYGVIYADPPWRFEPYSRETGMDRAADNHYPTMSLDTIRDMDVPAAPDCALFLWATVPMLQEALAVMEAWGFNYKTAMGWHKERPGTGYWFRNTLELLLVCTRGEVPAPAPGDQYEQVITAVVGRHSAKPAAFAEIIEDMFPTTPRLEMFAREPRLGWDVWGNEVDNHAA